ncbi:MAG TPA: hypothetical protein VKR06_31660, partial [Ktedonosporobacter sp.]|nr:hypothetical protein [Ktedonosporobacter sp.]
TIRAIDDLADHQALYSHFCFTFGTVCHGSIPPDNCLNDGSPQATARPRATARDRPYYMTGSQAAPTCIVGAIPCGRPALAVALPCDGMPNKKRPSSSNFGKDEERSICSRGTTFIRCSLTASASLYGVTVGVTCTSPANGGHPVEFYFRVGDFFSQLQGLLHGIGIRAFQQPPVLWMRQITVTRPCKAFTLCDCS